jgi:hypothetical protein
MFHAFSHPSLVWRVHLPLAPHGLAGGVGRAGRTKQFPRLLGREQFPMPFRDDLDGSVDHFDGGLVVDRVGRHWSTRLTPWNGL